MKRVSFLALLALLCAGISTPAQAQEHPGIQQKDTSWFAYDDAMTAAFLGGGGGDPVAACKAACNATYMAEAAACQGTTNEKNACVFQAAIRNNQCQQKC